MCFIFTSIQGLHPPYRLLFTPPTGVQHRTNSVGTTRASQVSPSGPLPRLRLLHPIVVHSRLSVERQAVFSLLMTVLMLTVVDLVVVTQQSSEERS